MISIDHINFHYKNCPPILHDITFTLDRGQCTCLLGPNGTGKSTFLKCLLNHYTPQSGSICIDGVPISSMSARERASHLAYVSQSSGLAFPYTVEEVVLMGRVAHMRLGAAISDRDRASARRAMEHLGISHMAQRNFQNLSGGERQMVLIARAITQQADYLILDEPTAALDYSNQVLILQMIRHLVADGYGILMTSHFPDHAFLTSTQVILMRDGTIMAIGTPEQTLTSENMTRLYQVPISVADVLTDPKTQTRKQKVCIPILQQ